MSLDKLLLLILGGIRKLILEVNWFVMISAEVYGILAERAQMRTEILTPDAMNLLIIQYLEV